MKVNLILRAMGSAPIILTFAAMLLISTSGAGASSSANVSSHQLPEILLIEDLGNSSTVIALKDNERPHYIVPKSVQHLQLKCQASYPVTWTSNSMEQDNVIGAESKRDVITFNDPTTYTYSMTLKLVMNYTGNTSSSFTYQAVRSYSNDLSTLISVVALKWEDSLQAYISILESVQQWNQSNPVNTNGDNFTLTVARNGDSSFNVKCCIPHGHGTHLVDVRAGQILLETGKCTQPLVCIKKTNILVQLTSSWYLASNEETWCLSTRFHWLWRKGRVDIVDYLPNIVACSLQHFVGVRQELRVAGQRRYRVVPPDNPSGLEYRSVRDQSKKKGWALITILTAAKNLNLNLTSAEFYVRDMLEFRCHASPHYYAHGIIWESRFQNGSSKFELGQSKKAFDSGGVVHNVAVLSVELIDDHLKRISCHIPPWNSTGWVTHSLVTTVTQSASPVTASGESFVQENHTFYTHETITLRCDLWGVPEPKYEWSTRRTNETAYTALDSRIVSDCPALIVSYDGKSNPNPFESLGTLPTERFSCLATNVAGNGSKIFNVQAIQSYKPAMGNAAREAVVIYTGDENTILNCSVSQGDPTPQFHWQRHGLNISMEENLNGSTWSAFVFKHARLEDEAEYTCVAKNVLGSTSKEFSVRVREVRVQERHNWFLTLTIVLALLVVALIGFMAYLCNSKKKAISRLEWTAEYAKRHVDMHSYESSVSVSTSST